MDARDRRPVGWDGHVLLLHRSEAQRRADVVTWVRRGLEAGAKIFYIEPSEQAAGRSLLGLLRGQAEALEAVERGQIEVVLADETACDPSWQEAMVGHALDEGYPSVRWSGEATAAWSVMSRARHADVERATDALCRTKQVSVMCQYDAREPGVELADLCAVHGGGLRDGVLSAFSFEGGVGVAGEVDRSNQETLSSLLSGATTRAQRDHFVVDLTRVDLLDVGGVRALVTGTAAYRELGGQVRLSGARPPVGQVLRLLRVDRSRGLLSEAV